MRASAIPLAPVRAATAPRKPWRWDQTSRRVAHEILASHRESLPGDGGRAVVSQAELTSTGMAVVFLGPLGGPACAVLKLPLTAGAERGLERETVALAALHTDDRLGEWRSLLPRPCARGSIEGRAYRIDSVLPGSPLVDPMTTAFDGGPWQAAVETICRLHAATATSLPESFDRAEQWVDVHLRELESRSAWRRPTVLAVERLREELHVALADYAGRAGGIHGDYWLGNLLFTEAKDRSERPSGIVDWDAWAPLELPLHDVLHLILYARRLRTRRELGDIVARQLLASAWSYEERQALIRAELGRRTGGLSERHVVLLYWLRQTAMHARQQPRQVGYRYRLWERRNVLPVVAAL